MASKKYPIMNLANICPEVDKRWNGEGEINLGWLEKHIKSCHHCQSIMRLVNATIIPAIRRELGDDAEEESN